MSNQKSFIVEPKLPDGRVTIGTEGGETEVYIGKVAEFGGTKKVYFDATKEFVTLIIGKRGSGKSFCLGSLLEGLCTNKDETSISKINTRRGVLLLDPMGNFWTSMFPVEGNGKPRVRAQFEMFEGWGCQPEDVNVVVWIPAGFQRDTDHSSIQEFHIDVADLDAADWADIVGTNLIRDPQGILLGEAIDAVRFSGWTDSDGRQIPANARYALQDVINYLEMVRDAANSGMPTDHAPQTCRALLRSFRGYSRLPLFTGGATPLTDIVKEGQLSILMLPSRIGHDLRRVLTRLLIRRVMREREEASQIRNRLDLQPNLGEDDKQRLEARLATLIPRTVLALDEAQELIGGEGHEARQALEDFCLLGRNYGLSMVLATQRPNVAAISAKVRAQVDTTIVHSLMTQQDIDSTYSDMQSAWVDSIKLRDRDLDYGSLIRSLGTGQAIVSSSRIVLERDSGRGEDFRDECPPACTNSRRRKQVKLITHIEPSQLRLGYLCCLALVAGRHLDTRQGLVDRLKKFVFQEVDGSDPRWSVFMQAVDPEELENLKAPVDEKRAELNELFRIKDSSVESYQLQALWLAQRELPSHVGLLTEKNTSRLMDMGKSFEILTDGYALSEKGVFLQSYLEMTLPGILDGAPTANPFVINSRPVLRLFMFYLLLSSDIMTPYLIQEFAESKAGDLSNSPKLLPLAGQRLSQGVEDITDISNVQALRGCSEYAKRLQTKAVARNQAQPRYHHLFELGLLDREVREKHGRRTIPYVATSAGLRAAEILAPLRQAAVEQQETIDRKFFGWASGIYELNAKQCEKDLRKLYYFAKGYPYLEREIGFTPGRMVAVAGCVMALVDGWVIEVDQMFQVLREMAAGPWRKYLEYSGGSRLDQEFLIKVKPEIISAIERELGRPELEANN